jgi:energy-coupling factor transporter ATP-binding protein EcfA2
MEGQGVAASAASAADGPGESGPGAGVAAELDHPAENHVTGDIADGGEGQERNVDDSNVTVAPGYPEASAQDANMSQSPGSSQSPRSPREERSSHQSQPELPSQQIESDKLDNIVDPDRNNSAVARDENTGQNQTAAGLAPPAVDAPAVNVPAADAPPAVTPPETAATVGPVPPEPAQPESGEPVTVQFPAVPPEATEPVSDSAPQSAQPQPQPQPQATQPEPAQPEPAQPEPAQPESGEPVTEQFPAVPSGTEPVSHSEPVAAAPSEPVTPEPVAAVRSRATARPRARVDARLLEAALLNLRKRIAAVPLVFQISGSAEVKTERRKLLSQIDDYLLPRVRRSAAPVLVALVGSTGAGKSTLVNSIVGAHVSATGVRRPTTNSPVLACHPDEIDWFAENNFLPTLPRVRQEGLARPGRDGLLVLAASEGMPRGIALLDTPDIDSVVQAHHEFAYQFLDASDLWLFVTSASRYADGPVWEILQHARERKASLGVVLSRIPQAYRTELVDHFNAMLDANGMAAADRFVIPEIPLIDGMLPLDAYQPIRDWLADTADRADRRVAVLSQTMSGVLDTFKTRIPAMAAHVEAQVVLRGELRQAVETAYQNAFAEASDSMKDGTLLRGEVLARWEDCVVGGDLRPRRGVKGSKPVRSGNKKGKRARRGPSRPAALNASLRSAIESLIVSIADRAAEHVEGSWRADPAGAVLLADAAAERARDVRAKQVFESVFGPAGQSGDGDPASADIKAADVIKAADAAHSSTFSRSSPDLAARATRAVGAWQDHLTRLVEGEDLRPTARRISFDEEALSLVVLMAMLGEAAPDAARSGAAGSGVRSAASASPAGPEGGSVYTEPLRMLASVFGEVMLTEILAKARTDLLDRVRLLLDEELVRFVEVLDAAGACDDVAAIRLYQAEFSLEAVR